MRDMYDAAYYLRREANARALARRATDPTIQRIHTDLADRYAERAAAAGRPKLRLFQPS